MMRYSELELLVGRSISHRRAEDPVTYLDIATDWTLWSLLVDPDGCMTEAEFDAMSTEEKLDGIAYMWEVEIKDGDDEVEDDDEEK